MHTWETLLIGNITGAILLAGFALLVGNWTKRPALAHTVWVLVLLKLVGVPIFTPGLIGPVGPTLATTPAALRATTPESMGIHDDDDHLAAHFADSHAIPVHPAVAERGHASIDPVRTLRVLLPLVLLSGALVVAGLAVVRILRFRRLIRAAPLAPNEVNARTAALAGALGMSVAPRVRLVDARISPALWSGRRCAILLPADLLPRLTTEELDTLLAHELAHVRRRDHWIRPLELVVSAIYWWFPLAGWARRRLRAAEEQACDAYVLRVLPDRARPYATGLLKTVEFVSAREPAMPGLTTAVSGATPLKERINMILNGAFPTTLAGPLRFGVVAVALTALLVSPGWVGSSSEVEEPEPEAEIVVEDEFTDQQDAEDRLSLIALRREELRLKKQLLDLEARHQELRTRIEETQVRLQQNEQREELARLEKDGNDEEAAQLRHEIIEQEAMLDLRVRQLGLERELGMQRTELEFQLQELHMQQEEHYARGEDGLAEELEQKMEKLERAMRELQLRELEADLQLRQQELEIEARRLQHEMMR